MGHSYNHGLVTSMKGVALEAVKITRLDQATCTISDQAGSGLFKSATISSGVVTITLNGPIPPKLLVCLPAVSAPNATTDLIHPRYIDNSYNATAGTFTIALSDDDDSGAPIAASPGSTIELHLFCVFKRYTGLPSV